jgi:hypothetical protein
MCVTEMMSNSVFHNGGLVWIDRGGIQQGENDLNQIHEENIASYDVSNIYGVDKLVGNAQSSAQIAWRKSKLLCCKSSNLCWKVEIS